MAQNIVSRHKIYFNWSRGLRNMSQKADFESDLTLPHSCHIMKKVGKKGKLWWEIGENGAKWRKLARISLQTAKKCIISVLICKLFLPHKTNKF